MTGRLLERRFKKKPEGDLGRTVRQPIGQHFFFKYIYVNLGVDGFWVEKLFEHFSGCGEWRMKAGILMG